jgi:peptidoglycan/xylan/chitin deacetylase (PgdA/CDA1 family)
MCADFVDHRPMAVILMYHRIASTTIDPHDTCVAPDTFRAHLDAIRKAGCHVVPLHELADRVRARDIPHRSVALTLDDGYVDGLTDAAPLLGEFGFPATFFVVADTLEEPYEYWWDALQRVFLSRRALPTTMCLDSLPPVATASEAERRSAHDLLVAGFYTCSRDRRDALLSEILDWSGIGPPEPESPRPMTVGELVRLADSPLVSIGSHTRSHLWLPAQQPSVQRQEILDSRVHLELSLKRQVTMFSYPYGAYAPETVDLVRDAGYLAAVTTFERTVTGHDDVLLLPRYGVSNWDAEEFGRRLQRAFAARAER